VAESPVLGQPAVPWTNVYGLARTILAGSLAWTLTATDPNILFRPALTSIAGASGGPLSSCSFFNLLGAHLALARYVAVGALLLTAAGWRPRFTAPFHAWLTWSFAVSCVPLDGGDQVANALALILLPVAVTDSRQWHWDPAPKVESSAAFIASRVALSAMMAVRVQVACIYLHAAIGKFSVKEWANGTAIYYWMLDPRIGLPDRLGDYVVSFLQPAGVSALLTWLPVLLELMLFLSLALRPDHRARQWLLIGGLIFHLGNVILFGLGSFFLSMSAALILLLRPFDFPFEFPVAAFDWVRSRFPVRRFLPGLEGSCSKS